jgi:ElaA protein
MIEWQWKSFEELSQFDLYEVIGLRENVFVVEQKVIYQDADGYDQAGHHLLGWKKIEGESRLVAYLRVIPPGVKFAERSIGRVITAPSIRGTGVGIELVQLGLEKIREHWGDSPVRICAQAHLQDFYGKFGFRSEGSEYSEFGTPHIEMVLGS